MASWAGTIVGMMGFRSVRTGGVTSMIRPARMPWGAMSACHNPSSSPRWNVICFPESPRRTFWNWRGGDDKKWSFDDGGGGMTVRGGDVQEQDAVESSNHKFAYPISVCSAQGYRSYMEDEYFVSLDGDFAAVFDGHGGPSVSRYLRKNLYASVQGVLPLITPATTTVYETDDVAWRTTGSAAELHNSSSTKTGPHGNRTADETTTAELHRMAFAASAAAPSFPTLEDYQTALESALEKVDREVQRISHWSYQGSTAVVIWIHEDRRTANADASSVDQPTSATSGDNDTTSTTSSDETNSASTTPTTTTTTTTTGQRTIIAANVGDSRAVLCRNSTAWNLTRDHKPNDPYEKERIEKLGGQVVWCGDTTKDGEPILERGIYRVNGNLALSRAIGDRSERPHVTAEPEIIAVPVLEDEDEFIIIATDGLWDVLESNEAVDLVQRLVDQGLPRDQVATWLVEESIRRGTFDNVTVVIIWLDRSAASATPTQ